MKAVTLAKWERKIRSLITKLPPEIVVKKYSEGRLDFLKKLKEEINFFVLIKLFLKVCKKVK